MTAPTFTGVALDNVGTLYHCAIGYDDGTGNVVMVGYVIPQGTQWEQTTNLQDEGQLISVASPNQIDRSLTAWPKVTQGDWTKGEQQLTYIDPQRYRSSDGGIDTSRPGQLQLYPSARTNTFTVTGAANLTPIVADGDQWYAGAKDASHNFVVGTPAWATPHQSSLGDGGEVFDILALPIGASFGTALHIYGIDATTDPPTVGVQANEGISNTVKSLAYFDDHIYFITADQTQIKQIDGGAGVSVFRTRGAGEFEISFRAICSTAGGLFYATYHTTSPQNIVLYVCNGGSGPDTRVADLWGDLEYCGEIYGVTYILLRPYQDAGHQDFVLYALQGTQLTQILDMRWAPEEFRTTTSIASHGNVWGDGRFLYIGWPGQPGLRLDLNPATQAGIARCTPYNPASQSAHKMVSVGTIRLAEAVTKTVAGVTTTTFNEYFGVPTTGSLVMSDVDFDTPGESKAFRAVYVELDAPIPSGASVVITYAVDGDSVYHATVAMADSTTRFTYRIPRGTSGRRISVKVTLNAGSNLSPVIRSIAVEGTLGRVWKATLQCNARQELLDGNTDNQSMNSRQLLANIESAFESAARKVYAYVPSLNGADQVEQVQATIETYSWKSSRPGSFQGGNLEGNIDVILKETL